MDHVIQYFDYFAFPFPVQKQSDVFVITIQHYDFLLLPLGEFKIHIHLLTKANIFKKNYHNPALLCMYLWFIFSAYRVGRTDSIIPSTTVHTSTSLFFSIVHK